MLLVLGETGRAYMVNGILGQLEDLYQRVRQGKKIYPVIPIDEETRFDCNQRKCEQVILDLHAIVVGGH